MRDRLTKVIAGMREFALRFSLPRRTPAIRNTADLRRFVSTRAAFVAQKTLYGYVKTRMGTRYRSMFEDDTFIASVNIAKMHVFAACLSDLAIYATAHALARLDDGDDQRRRLASACFRAGFGDNADEAAKVASFSVDAMIGEFERRVAMTDWQGVALDPDGFTRSPAALIRWAPIAPELKDQDEEIIRNSIRFAWREVRNELASALQAAEIEAEIEAEIGRQADRKERPAD